jgi:hypothetical protein
MSDWLDEKLGTQALRDRQLQDKAERERRQADAVRANLSPYVAALGNHIQALSDRYNEANVGRPDREMLYTPQVGGFAVGHTGFSSSVRAVYCTANPDLAVISVEWRLPSDSDTGNSRKVDLSVVVRRDGKVVASNGVDRYREIDDLARFSWSLFFS